MRVRRRGARAARALGWVRGQWTPQGAAGPRSELVREQVRALELEPVREQVRALELEQVRVRARVPVQPQASP